MSETLHSQLGASSSHRWMNCPGSVSLCANIPRVSSSYADEGTFAHDVSAEVLLTGVMRDGITDEMKDAVNVYVETIKADQFASTDLFIEKRFELNEISEGMFGTADAVIYDSITTTLRVYDFKYGAGVPVEVEENSQLMYYALGAFNALKIPADPALTIELVIVQPRCAHPDGPVRRWSFNLERLFTFADELADAANATKNPRATLKTGDHCRFCPAIGICPKLQETALELAKTEFSPIASYTPESLAYALTKLSAVEAWAKGVREFAYREAASGREIPGFKLVAKRATRKWANEADVVESLKAHGITADELYERSILSPAQVEKTFKGQFPKEILAELVVAQSSGNTLVPNSDKRERISTDAASEFTMIEQID